VTLTAGGTASALSFYADAQSGSLNVLGGSHSIRAPIITEGDLSIGVNAGQLSLNGALSESGPSAALVKTGTAG
jgi:hypothetical protein